MLRRNSPRSTPRRSPALINAVPVRLTGTASIDRAISTAGGIALDELDERFMLRRRPGSFAAGEMLDWEAPTGGYLLQASFATGARLPAARWRGLRNTGSRPCDCCRSPVRSYVEGDQDKAGQRPPEQAMSNDRRRPTIANAEMCAEP